MCHVITTTSTYADQILSRCISGTVHSVYKKTINIQLGQHLLALQQAASPLSPISLLTDMEEGAMDKLSIHPGQPVQIRGRKIEISRPGYMASGFTASFLYEPEGIYDSKLASPPPGFSRTELEARILSVLGASNAGGFCPLLVSSQKAEEYDLVLQSASKRTAACAHLLDQDMYKEAASILAEVLGLGIGLTPSGDDFLCGVLAGLIFCNQAAHPFALELARQIRARLYDTNDISRAFLNCALDSHFSKAVSTLSLLPSAEDILESFSAIGHSSGMDTLCGIAYALNLSLAR